MMVNATASPNNGGFSNFLKMKWRTSKDPKLNYRYKGPNTADDIERDWIRHSALKLAFEGDFKAPLKRMLQAGGVEVLDIGCGAGFWTAEMAGHFPISYFTGIDIDKNVLPSNGLPKNSLYQQVDLLELPLPYEDGTFDYIFIRSMIDILPDTMWDDVLKELLRIMKKGAFIECVEAYDNLFDAGPAMTKISQLTRTTATATPDSPGADNPWPNRIANQSQLVGMQIYHTHTPVGLYGETVGSLFLEYWERAVRRDRREWVNLKLITEEELENLTDLLKEEVEQNNTYMSWYSVVARKKGYSGPTIQFDDVDDFDTLHTTIY